jgi:hypothetical protein
MFWSLQIAWCRRDVAVAERRLPLRVCRHFILKLLHCTRAEPYELSNLQYAKTFGKVLLCLLCRY